MYRQPARKAPTRPRIEGRGRQQQPCSPRSPGNRRIEVGSPHRGRWDGLEIRYWNVARQAAVTVRLRRFEVLCLLIIILSVIASFEGSGVTFRELVHVAGYWLRPL